MKTTRPMHLLNLALLGLLCAPLVVMADDEHERRGKREGGEYKEKFRDGNCKVAREWKDGKYKEERECEGPSEHRPPASRAVIVHPAPRVIIVQPAPQFMVPVPVMVYPPWVIYEQGQPVYRPGREPRPVVQRGAVHCNSESVGQVMGGIAGAVLGNQVGKGNGRAVATVGGAVAGVLIGGSIGRQIDAGNQACIGKALEFARVDQRIEWTSTADLQYAVVPGRMERRGNRYCRHYDAEVYTDSGWQTTRGVACRRPDGVWVASR